jgi:hypothetical protein
MLKKSEEKWRLQDLTPRFLLMSGLQAWPSKRIELPA